MDPARVKQSSPCAMGGVSKKRTDHLECIAKALVLAVQYIADRGEEQDSDSDVEQLENIASILSGCSEAERRALEAIAREVGFLEWAEQVGLRRRD
jgi:tRNA(Ile)-lysidine synthase TilS/MesJ